LYPEGYVSIHVRISLSPRPPQQHGHGDDRRQAEHEAG